MTSPEVPVTVEERALKLWRDIIEGCGSSADIAKALQAAREEGLKEKLGKCNEHTMGRYPACSVCLCEELDKAKAKGFREAIEKAAKVAETEFYKTQVQGLPLYTSDDMAALIRALKAGV